MNFKKGERLCVSLETLYTELNGVPGETLDLANGNTIVNTDDDYFDLIGEDGDILCMDGETCEVEEVLEDGSVRFKCIDGEHDTHFTLSASEAGSALYEIPD